LANISIGELASIIGQAWLSDQIMEAYIMNRIKERNLGHGVVLQGAPLVNKILLQLKDPGYLIPAKISIFLVNEFGVHWTLIFIDSLSRSYIFFTLYRVKTNIWANFQTFFLISAPI
jgi:hypothetical protein